MAQERMVTRKVIESKTYQVYSLVDGVLKELKQITAKGKVSERELEKELKVDKVVLVPISEKKVTYGMKVSDFMKYAKVVEETDDSKEKDATDNTADNKEQAQNETK
jgi:hypothetical protein